MNARRVNRLLAIAAAGACLGALAADASAPRGVPAAEEGTLMALEQAFWLCDYTATTRGAQATPIAACRYVTEELKKRKFGGDFEAFLGWWQIHKAAEHEKLALHD